MGLPVPLGGRGGSGIVRSLWGRTVWWAAGASRGPGLTVIVVEGSHVPGSVWPAAVVVCGGVDDRALGDRDVDEGLDGVVLGGRLCGGGSCLWEGGVGCDGSGVLACVRVSVRAMLLEFASLRLWCCGLHGVVLVVVLLLVVRSLGTSLGLGSCFGFGSSSRLRRTSVRRCEGAGVGWGSFPVCCRGAWVACLGVGGSLVAWRAAADLAFARALWMGSAGGGGSEDEEEDVDEAEEEEEVVVFGDAGCAVMRAVAGFWAAASAAATAGRVEGMSSGCR